jgi:alkanesulfonate monooxygenase SsuD/methylene tetrahydromethanopterin reductase-like flavin-dependent oxidoreductase (luciferase family)
VGVGRGANGGSELTLWGRDGSDSDGLFRETLEILLKGFKHEFLSHEGKHYQFENLWMELRPVQKPHPAFWYAGNPVHAGELGMNFIGAGSIARVKASSAKYLEAWTRGQADPSPCTAMLAQPIYGGMRHMFIADSDAEAHERGRVAYEAYRRHFRKPLPPGVERKLPPALAARLATASGPASESSEASRQRFFGPAAFTPDEAIAGESLLLGSPSTIRDYVLRYARESDANYYVGSFSWGDLTHEESSKSLRLFAEEVMPAIM